MKKLRNVKNSFALSIAGLLMLVLFLGACKKDNDNTYVRTPAAGLMAFNLSADKPAIGYSLSGNTLTNTALTYTSYTGNYLPVYVGTREVRSFDYTSGSTIAISNNDFKDSSYYSAFLVGANGSYRNVVVKDELDSLTAVTGKAWVRYINAVADSAASPIVTISAGAESAFNEAAAYASVSGFKPVNAGSVNAAVNNGGGIAASRAITLEQNKIYTVLFSGLPNQADSTKAVQVRFIQNGTVTP